LLIFCPLVVQAEGLTPTNLETGLCNAYCVVILGKNKKRTETIKDTLAPKWDETFVLEVKRATSIHFQFWDKQAFSHDELMCELEVILTAIKPDGSENWFKMQPKKGSTGVEVYSKLLVRFLLAEAGQAEQVEQNLPSSTVNKLKDITKKSVPTLELDLSASKLTRCPKFIAEYSIHWKNMNLSFNQFGLYPNLSQFVYLQQLNLSANQLSAVPSHVGYLSKLEEFYLYGNLISFLPAEIGNCTSLIKLDMANNQLSSLPKEIGALTRLEELNLNGNPLVLLPKEIGNCIGMEILDMSCCMLKKLPDEFTGMTRLLELNLGTNKLEILTSSMGKLSRLVTLNLCDNLLADLPVSMGYCIGLKSCHIDRNPITDPELFRKYRIGTDHLVDYLEKRLDSVIARRGIGELIEAEEEEIQRKEERKQQRLKELEDAKNLQESTVDPWEDIEFQQKLQRLKQLANQLIVECKKSIQAMRQIVVHQKELPPLMELGTRVKNLRAIYSSYPAELEYSKMHILPSQKIKPIFVVTPGCDNITKLKAVIDVTITDIDMVLSGIVQLLRRSGSQEELMPIFKMLRNLKVILE